MKIIRAKILDATHVALSQHVQEEEDVWRATTQQHFFTAYDDQDAIYDDL